MSRGNGVSELTVLRAEVAELRSAMMRAAQIVGEKDRRAALVTQVCCVLMRRLEKDRIVLGETDLLDALMHCGMRVAMEFVPAEEKGKPDVCVVTLPVLTPEERVAQEEAIKRSAEAPKPPDEGHPRALRLVL